MARKNEIRLQVEMLEERCTPSATPALGQAFGTSSLAEVRYQQSLGTNLGLADCASQPHPGGASIEVISFLAPPGQV